MKEVVLTYWVTLKDPQTGKIVWQRPVDGVIVKDGNGNEGLKVVGFPEGNIPQGNFILEWEPAWQEIETRPEKLIE